MSLKILPLIRKAICSTIRNQYLLTFHKPRQLSKSREDGMKKREKLILVTWIQTIRSIKFQEFLKEFGYGLMIKNWFVELTLYQMKMVLTKKVELLEPNHKTKQCFSSSRMISLDSLMEASLNKVFWTSLCWSQLWILVWDSVLRLDLTNLTAESRIMNQWQEFHVQ